MPEHDDGTMIAHVRILENHTGRLDRAEERMNKIELLLEKYDERMDAMDKQDTQEIAVLKEGLTGARKLLWWLIGGITSVGAGVVVLLVKLLTGGE